MIPWLRYLIAFVVACHGFTYIPFGLVVTRTARASLARTHRSAGNFQDR